MIADLERSSRSSMKRRRSPDIDDKPRKVYSRPDSKMWLPPKEVKEETFSDIPVKKKKKKKKKKKRRKYSSRTPPGPPPRSPGLRRSRSRSHGRWEKDTQRSVSGTRSPNRQSKANESGATEWQIVSGDNKEASLKAKLGNLEKNLHMKLVDVGLDEKNNSNNPNKPRLGLTTLIHKKKDSKAKSISAAKAKKTSRLLTFNLLKHSRKPKKMTTFTKIKMSLGGSRTKPAPAPAVKEEKTSNPPLMLPSTMPLKRLSPPKEVAEPVTSTAEEPVSGTVKSEPVFTHTQQPQPSLSVPQQQLASPMMPSSPAGVVKQQMQQPIPMQPQALQLQPQPTMQQQPLQQMVSSPKMQQLQEQQQVQQKQLIQQPQLQQPQTHLQMQQTQLQPQLQQPQMQQALQMQQQQQVRQMQFQQALQVQQVLQVQRQMQLRALHNPFAQQQLMLQQQMMQQQHNQMLLQQLQQQQVARQNILSSPRPNLQQNIPQPTQHPAPTPQLIQPQQNNQQPPQPATPQVSTPPQPALKPPAGLAQPSANPGPAPPPAVKSEGPPNTPTPEQANPPKPLVNASPPNPQMDATSAAPGSGDHMGKSEKVSPTTPSSPGTMQPSPAQPKADSKEPRLLSSQEQQAHIMQTAQQLQQVAKLQQQARALQIQQMQRRATLHQLMQQQQLQLQARAVMAPGLVVPQPIPVILPQVAPTTLVPVQLAPLTPRVVPAVRQKIVRKPTITTTIRRNSNTESFPPTNPEPVTRASIPEEDDSTELEELKPVTGAEPKESSSSFTVVKKNYSSGTAMKLPAATRDMLAKNLSSSRSSYSSRSRSSSRSSVSRSRSPSASLTPTSKQKRDIHRELLKQRESASNSYRRRSRTGSRRRSRTDSRSRSRSSKESSSSRSSSGER